ncbi:MAG: hypothetical protein IJT25_01060 [Clostridia bacterium]|nr:hypothetical protein [Clostridia bacterium]
MKKVFLSVLMMGIIISAGFLFTGCENLETVALKNGVIKHEYTIGESFDPAGAVIVEKTNKGYKEFSLVYCTYRLTGFSTASTCTNASAYIIYKDHSIEFKYSVAPKDLGEINVSVEGAQYNTTSGKYELTYDGNLHDINIECETEDVSIEKIQTTITNQKLPFNGATNAGNYAVSVAVSKEGYATRNFEVNILVKQLEVSEIDYYLYNRLNKTTSLKNAETIEYYYPNGYAIGVFEVRAFAKDPRNGEYLYYNGNSILSLAGSTEATEIGAYTAKVNGVFATTDGISNYKIADTANKEFNYSIEKSSAASSLITNSSVHFEGKTVSYDGNAKTIVANESIVINNEAPTSISYEYYDNNGTLLNTNGEGVFAIGTYTVKAIYNFTHYTTVSLEAILVIE